MRAEPCSLYLLAPSVWLRDPPDDGTAGTVSKTDIHNGKHTTPSARPVGTTAPQVYGQIYSNLDDLVFIMLISHAVGYDMGVSLFGGKEIMRR